MNDANHHEQHGLLWALGRVAQHKDAQAWSVLVADAGPDVLRLAMRMTGDHGLAEDIVQETFMLVRDHADRFIVRDGGGDDDARRWILAVATNAGLHLTRRHRRQMHRDVRAGHAATLTATPVPAPSQQTEDADDGQLLRRELAELPLTYGQVLTLHYFANQDYPQLASQLRVSVSTIRSRVEQGLKLLRQRLERCGVTLSIAALTGLLSNLGAAPVAAVALPASTLGIINSSAVATTTFVGASTIASGGLVFATLLSTVLAATITVMGWANGWFSSPTEPLESAHVAAVPVLSAVEPPAPLPVVPPGPGAEVPGKPFILVVKTDQETRFEFGTRPSDSNQFMLPLSIDYAYDFTVDWGDGAKEVVQLPLSATLIQLLNKRIPAQNRNYTLEEALAYLQQETQAHITLDPESAPRLHHQAAEGIGRGFDGDPRPDPKDPKPLQHDFFRQEQTLREAIREVHRFYPVAFSRRDGSISITDDKKKHGDLFIVHTYAKPGIYRVQITANVPDGFSAIRFDRQGDQDKLHEIAQWGDSRWSTMESAFYGCENLSITATDSATARTETVANYRHAWANCSSLKSFPLLNTAGGTNFSYAWWCCTGLTSFPLLNTTAGTDFSHAWYQCWRLTSFPLLNTAAGTDFSSAWSSCSGLTSFPLLNTAAGTNFTGAWTGCRGLTSFPLLNTAAGTNFTGAWIGCRGLTSFPVLNTAAGTTFSRAWAGCSGLTSFPLLNTTAGTSFSNAWEECSGLTSFPLLNTAAGTSFSGAWEGCSGLTSFPLLDTAQGTNFSLAWANCRSLTSFPLLNTAQGIRFAGAWSGCSGLASFPLLNTAQGTDFVRAWGGCRGLTSFPLLNTESATTLSEAWSGCSGLTSFPLLNTAAVTSFGWAWSKCSGLTSFPMLDTSAGSSFDFAWEGCSGLTSFPLLNTANGTDFAYAWSDCRGLTSFPLLNIAAGIDFRHAWQNCSGLTDFPLLNTAKGNDFDYAWSGCTSLATFPAIDFGNMKTAKGAFDGTPLNPKPNPQRKKKRPQEPLPKPDEANEF